jgi:2-polyprenyl-3-methyl-5-hydroxy-6-metoxy-1,4-benzoquinol methylase
VGVDHNAESVSVARSKGLEAYTVDEFRASPISAPAQFDSILLAHVIEHVTREDAVALVKDYLPSLRPSGRVCFITPQERGYATDATHVQFTDFAALGELSTVLGLRVSRQFSFPFPRAVGRVFPYNEFVVIAQLK